MQIWELTAGSSPSMTKPQFFAALRLCSLAQSKGGTFQPQEGRAVIIGTAAPLPMPKLEGLESVAPAPAARPSQFSGGGLGGAQYPSISPQDVMRYESLFVRLDRDRDGFVQGAECAGEFMSMGVEKTVLRDIWGVVAGNKSFLSSSDFTKCIYLIELTRQGIPPPKVLPPGPFPPVSGSPASSPGQQSTVPGSAMAYGATNVSMPTALPPKASFAPPDPQTYSSRLPAVDETKLSMLPADDQQRLMAEMKVGIEKDSQLFKAEQELELGRQKREFYEKAMQEIRLFKSRTDVKLLEVEEKARHAMREADAVEKRYEDTRKEAEEEIKRGGSLIQSIHEAQERKREKESLLQSLKNEVAAIEQTTPDDLRKIEEEIQSAQAAVTAVEAKKNGLNAQLESYRRQHDLLVGRKGDLELAIAAAEAEVHSAKADVENLRSKVEASKASDDVEQIQNLLIASARVYTTLHAHASKAGIEIPAEARLSLYGRDLIWSEDLVGTAAWDDWGEDGFIMVDAFPDTKDEMHQAIIDAVMAASSTQPGGGSLDLDKSSASVPAPAIFDSPGWRFQPEDATGTAVPSVGAAAVATGPILQSFGESDAFGGFSSEPQSSSTVPPHPGPQATGQDLGQGTSWKAF